MSHHNDPTDPARITWTETDPDRIRWNEYQKFRRSDTGKHVEQTCESLWSGYPSEYTMGCYTNPGTGNLKKWSDAEHKLEHWMKDNREMYRATQFSNNAQFNRIRACNAGIVDGSNCDRDVDDSGRYNTGVYRWWDHGGYSMRGIMDGSN